MSFVDVETICEDKTVTTSTLNIPLVEFIHFDSFLLLPISLVLFTHLFTDACEFAKVGLKYTMNQFV